MTCRVYSVLFWQQSEVNPTGEPSIEGTSLEDFTCLEVESRGLVPILGQRVWRMGEVTWLLRHVSKLPNVTCCSLFPPFSTEKSFNQRGIAAGSFALADYTFRFCYMESLRGARLGVLIVLLQVLSSGFAESPPCSPGFDADLFVFTVHREHLHRGRRLGKVVFDDCSGRTRTVFDSADKRFQVDADGTVKLKRQITLHEGHRMFSVHAWDSKGKKHTAFVRVEHEAKTNHHRGHQEDTEAVIPAQSESPSDVPIMEFPKSSGGLRRRKREWVIPPIKTPENDRGPFPKFVVQIKSSYAKETKMVYSISGEGADLDPKGLFTIKRNDGSLYVTRPLDREAKDKYVLQAHAIAADGEDKEDPMEIIVEVIDMNDNTPVFTQNPFLGSVPEASPKEFEFMTVTATDADEPNNDNADVRYSILSQNPQLPDPNMFVINPVTGAIRVNAAGLDREKYPQYTLTIAAGDMQGEGRVGTGTAVITVTDSNDNAPQFEKTSYTVSVPENKVGAVVVKMPVTDGDEPQSPAWTAKFRIISGNNGGFFNVSTGPNKQEGIITTVKPLDFEKTNKYTLLVVAENDVPFAKPLTTSTATVIVNVQDVNEAPVFDPEEKIISKPEDVAVGSELTVYTATDPDTAKTQKVTYRVGTDPAGWLSVDGETGLIKVRSPMDRESPFVKDGTYKALILAMDDDPVPATGTGTLVIELKDVNDNAPSIEERMITVCNKESTPVLLSVTDKDGPGFAAPYRVELQGDSMKNWTAMMNETKTGIVLRLKTPLEHGQYNVIMRIYDNMNLYQDNTVQASVCDCTGDNVQCHEKAVAAFGLPGILGILGAILALLVLLLLLLLFVRRKRTVKKEPLLADDDIRDNVYCYDEEGGGEDDQDYDLSVLHRGLDNRPDVFRNDVAPTFMPAPQYRPRPANPEEIGTFIDDNLKAADNDPTAPPYDSLLVFDYEGGGSDAGSLSSLNSSSSGDQDYNCLSEWGPRFKKLADMYGGGEDELL
ncbi:B-cadherin-like [Colossoma macropomum]|uniref:B-cadherin-like n=1 Tax=Colossoma macropomum TaxID=42526 RepID=UPI00186436F3|nr:B-cadherin-like [Colossoma macropomum]